MFAAPEPAVKMLLASVGWHSQHAQVSSREKRTKQKRLQATTAQKTLSGPTDPQSMMSVSPGDHTPGRRPRRCSRRPAALAAATSRRKLRAEPTLPRPRASGRSRFAEIRPSVSSISLISWGLLRPGRGAVSTTTVSDRGTSLVDGSARGEDL